LGDKGEVAVRKGGKKKGETIVSYFAGELDKGRRNP